MHVKTQNWQERFDKKFTYNGAVSAYSEDIKSFITSLLEERDKELLQWLQDEGEISTYDRERLSDLLEEKK